MFCLAVDESEVSQTAILNLGIFDANCQYQCLGSRVMTGSKNAVNTSELMFDMVQKFPELIPKLDSIISDQAAYQLAANRRFSRMIQKELKQLTCSLHTTSNGDTIFTGCLPLAEEANHYSQLMFGSRQNWDHSDSSLRSELEIALQIEENRSKSEVCSSMSAVI